MSLSGLIEGGPVKKIRRNKPKSEESKNKTAAVPVRKRPMTHAEQFANPIYQVVVDDKGNAKTVVDRYWETVSQSYYYRECEDCCRPLLGDGQPELLLPGVRLVMGGAARRPWNIPNTVYTHNKRRDKQKVTPPEPLYIALAGLDFSWYQDEIAKVTSWWNRGVSVKRMAELLDRDPDEVAILIMDLTRTRKIKPRNDGVFGSG